MKKILIIFLILGLVGAVWAKSIILKLTGLTTTGISAYEVVYISANNICSKADANVAKAACGIYMGISGEVWIEGKFTNSAWNTSSKPTWEAGDTLWLSETQGEFTDSPPTTADSIVQILGEIISIDGNSTKIYFKPSSEFFVN